MFPCDSCVRYSDSWGSPTDILLMVQKSCGHQWRLVVYPMIYKVLYIPGGARFIPSTVCINSLSDVYIYIQDVALVKFMKSICFSLTR